MLRTSTPKKFDCVQFTREARRRIYEETKHMSHEELSEYYRTYPYSDPVLERLAARARQKEGQPDDAKKA